MSELKECRAAFEAWASDENKSPRAIEKDDTGDCYMLMQTHSAWMAWKASWKAQANADRVDALRYRWLLDNYAFGDGYDSIDSALNDGEADKYLSPAIDAAIRVASKTTEAEG